MVSKRNLELRFKKALGHTPGVEIRRAKVARARMLLAESDLSITRIAAECGFRYLSNFNVLFRRVMNQTPSAYRKQIREG